MTHLATCNIWHYVYSGEDRTSPERGNQVKTKIFILSLFPTHARLPNTFPFHNCRSPVAVLMRHVGRNVHFTSARGVYDVSVCAQPNPLTADRVAATGYSRRYLESAARCAATLPGIIAAVPTLTRLRMFIPCAFGGC